MDKIEDTLNRENLSLSTTNSRALAYLIDDLIISLLVVAIYWSNFVATPDFTSKIELINSAFIEILTIKIIYHTFFIWIYGQSVGKMILKIRVISIDTLDRPTFAFAFNRAIFRVLSEIIFYLGFLIAFFDRYRQTLQDKSAKTLVVDV
jgi:uncharacterized RDD family membrane protein YckC